MCLFSMHEADSFAGSLILLGRVNVLVYTSVQIKVTKARERLDQTQQAVITAFLMQQQPYVYGWPGYVYGWPVWGLSFF